MAIVATAVAVAAVNRVIAAVVVVEARTIPGAGADEQAAYEPVRTVVAVGRATIGRVAIVAIRADRRSRRVIGILIRGSVARIRVGRLSVGGIGWSADSDTN
jgi:hypothetical protein